MFRLHQHVILIKTVRRRHIFHFYHHSVRCNRTNCFVFYTFPVFCLLSLLSCKLPFLIERKRHLKTAYYSLLNSFLQISTSVCHMRLLKNTSVCSNADRSPGWSCYINTGLLFSVIVWSCFRPCYCFHPISTFINHFRHYTLFHESIRLCLTL